MCDGALHLGSLVLVGQQRFAVIQEKGPCIGKVLGLLRAVTLQDKSMCPGDDAEGASSVDTLPTHNEVLLGSE